MAKQNKTYPVRNQDNFLEALRGLGSGVVNDVKDHLQDAFDINTSRELKPDQSFSMEDLKKTEKKFVNRLDQERTLFLRQEQETKVQIKSIVDEIQKLAKVTGELAKEVQVASFMAPANPGVYHKNFFEQLKSLINNIRLKVQESRHWLATTNSRAQKKKGYWGQVQTSGTKFMMSQERYAVTSTG